MPRSRHGELTPIMRPQPFVTGHGWPARGPFYCRRLAAAPPHSPRCNWAPAFSPGCSQSSEGTNPGSSRMIRRQLSDTFMTNPDGVVADRWAFLPLAELNRVPKATSARRPSHRPSFASANRSGIISRQGRTSVIPYSSPTRNEATSHLLPTRSTSNRYTASDSNSTRSLPSPSAVTCSPTPKIPGGMSRTRSFATLSDTQ